MYLRLFSQILQLSPALEKYFSSQIFKISISSCFLMKNHFIHLHPAATGWTGCFLDLFHIRSLGFSICHVFVFIHLCLVSWTYSYLVLPLRFFSHLLKPCCLNWGSLISNISITWECGRNAEAQASPATNWMTSFSLTRSPGDLHMH